MSAKQRIRTLEGPKNKIQLNPMSTLDCSSCELWSKPFEGLNMALLSIILFGCQPSGAEVVEFGLPGDTNPWSSKFPEDLYEAPEKVVCTYLQYIHEYFSIYTCTHIYLCTYYQYVLGAIWNGTPSRPNPKPYKNRWLVGLTGVTQICEVIEDL